MIFSLNITVIAFSLPLRGLYHGYSLPDTSHKALFIMIRLIVYNGHRPIQLLQKEQPHHLVVKSHF